MIALQLTLAVTRIVSLSQALESARVHQPTVRQAHATTDVYRARADEARSGLLPQLNGTATYQRSTANFVSRPGALPKTAVTTTTGMSTTAQTSNFDTFNYFNFGLTLSQNVYDFQTPERWRASIATADAQEATEHATSLMVELNVRTAFFTARAEKALVGVARETVDNQKRHLEQIEGFVKAGTHPEIDLAQARTNYANARVQFITAENNYEAGKAQLNQAMGVEGETDFDVSDDTIPALSEEQNPLDTLVDSSIKARPEFLAMEKQIRAQELTLRASWGGYGPALGVSTSLTDGGVDISKLAWNWNLSATATWNLFSGLNTRAQIQEARANMESLKAQRDALRLQVRLEVDQARLAVRANREALSASEDALVSAREQLRLAEGRYQAGVGNSIELSDGQLALTNAGGQRVQAEYNLATARAQLIKALGQR